jgi:hypothetical protein
LSVEHQGSTHPSAERDVNQRTFPDIAQVPLPESSSVRIHLNVAGTAEAFFQKQAERDIPPLWLMQRGNGSPTAINGSADANTDGANVSPCCHCLDGSHKLLEPL